MNAEDWRRIVDINLWGVIHGTRLAYAIMREQGAGHIANTASMAGLSPVAYSAAYSATKHAVVGLSLALREEARPHGIGVSVICPGVVDTGIFGSASDVGGYSYARTIDKVPGGRTTPANAPSAPSSVRARSTRSRHGSRVSRTTRVHAISRPRG